MHEEPPKGKYEEVGDNQRDEDVKDEVEKLDRDRSVPLWLFH